MFEQLNFILETKISKEFDENNPFSIKKESISRGNSQDSGLGFEMDVEKNQSCVTLTNENKGEKNISSSSKSRNSL